MERLKARTCYTLSCSRRYIQYTKTDCICQSLPVNLMFTLVPRLALRTVLRLVPCRHSLATQ